jgi:hypothetical protein
MNIKTELHLAFLRALGNSVIAHSPVEDMPLTVDLRVPRPPRLRVYMYNLIAGSAQRPSEYKVSVRLRKQPVGAFHSFDHSGGRLALLIGYRRDLDVFVLWDASLHPRFTNGWNIQVRDFTVNQAAASGRGKQLRVLSTGVCEIVIACQSWSLGQAIDDRVAWTGGAGDE